MQIELNQNSIVYLCDALAHSEALLKAGKQPESIGQLSVFLLIGKQEDRQPFNLAAESLLNHEAFCRDLSHKVGGRFGRESGFRVVKSDITREFHDVRQRAVIDDLIAVPGWATVLLAADGHSEEWPLVAKLSLNKQKINNIYRSLRKSY